MPQMDGTELIRRIRETIDPVPVIVVITTLDFPTARGHALGSGADDYFAKPYKLRDVLRLLENCFERRR